MAVVINSAISGLSDLTISCMATPSDKASLAFTRTSTPPRKTPDRSSVWELLPSGTLSDRSQGWRPRKRTMFLTASSRVFMGREKVSESSLPSPTSSQADPKLPWIDIIDYLYLKYKREERRQHASDNEYKANNISMMNY